jgi:hypothetical protein
VGEPALGSVHRTGLGRILGDRVTRRDLARNPPPVLGDGTGIVTDVITEVQRGVARPRHTTVAIREPDDRVPEVDATRATD